MSLGDDGDEEKGDLDDIALLDNRPIDFSGGVNPDGAHMESVRKYGRNCYLCTCITACTVYMCVIKKLYILSNVILTLKFYSSVNVEFYIVN